MLRRALAAALLVAAVSCGGGDTAAPITNNTPGEIASITVTGAGTVNIGSSITLTATPRDVSGNVITGKTINWSSSSDAFATVTTAGVVTGLQAGSVTISASADAITGLRTINVVPVVNTPAVASITISGTTALQAGQTTKLTAVAKDAAGAVVQATILWSSSDGTLISVASDGTVSASRIGSVTITAAAGGVAATTPFTSSLTPYTFVFAASTTTQDQQIIKDGVQYAHASHQSVFGRQIQLPTTVSSSTTAQGCAQGGAAAFTGPQAVTFCTANPGWTQPGIVMRTKIAIHETFHVWQYEYHWVGHNSPTLDGATWIVEGSAELMGFRGLADRGLLAYPTAFGCQVKQVADFTGNLPPLSGMETPQTFGVPGPVYPLAMLGMDYLATAGPSASGLISLKAYGDALNAGTPWQTAFLTAFGQSTTTFYANFPPYRAGLIPPGQFLCGI